MSLYSLLAMYEEELTLLQEVVEQINDLTEQVEGLNDATRNTIEVDGEPYKFEKIENAKGSLSSAAGYISGTAILEIQKKIDEVKAAIEAYEEEQRRKEEENS